MTLHTLVISVVCFAGNTKVSGTENELSASVISLRANSDQNKM